MKRRIMALDVGEATLGVALSDPLGITAQPLTTLRRKSLAKDLGEIRSLVDRHDVEAIVIGLPLTLAGERGPAAQKVEAFAAKLERSLDLPVETWDERFTTVQAERALLEADTSRGRRRRVINQIAAALILQSYLEAGHAEKP